LLRNIDILPFFGVPLYSTWWVSWMD